VEPSELPDQDLRALARLSAVPRLLRSVDTRRPWLLDGLIALLVVFLMALPTMTKGEFIAENAGKPAVLLWSLFAALAGPLLWRRRAPVTVWLVICAVTTAHWAMGVAVPSVFALVAGLYAVALYARLVFLPWACGLTLVELLLTATRFVPSGLFDQVILAVAATTAAATFGLAVRIGQAYMRALEERADRLEVERDQRALLAAAGERARISREMHDVIGHHLAVIVGLADGGSALSRTVPERGTEALTSIAGVGRQALTELRGLLGVLQDGSADAELSPQPTLDDLDSLFEHVRTAGLPVRFRASGRFDTLPTGIQVVLYRLIQESLTNTLKHAGPGATASVELSVAHGMARLAVADTGVAKPDRPSAEGRGLTGIRERAALFGGTAAAGPRPGGGWLVTVAIPLKELS
jgi:signal transduction histidine kinase